MKNVNQLLHQTEDIEILKSILENGLYSSFTLEHFSEKNMLIPMISFSNIQFRDIGKQEVVNYGSYGIGIDRETGIELGLNPVIYTYGNSIIVKGMENNFQFSILPQTLSIAKDFSKRSNGAIMTDHITFNPFPSEIKDLFNSISKDTSDELLASIKNLFEKVFENSYHQILLAKPYKTTNKQGESFIAYNEREWRKSFFDLNSINEYKPNGKIDDEFIKWKETTKPHFTDNEHTLKIPIEKLKFIVVENETEIQLIREFLLKRYDNIPNTLKIDTLDNFKNREK